MLERAVRENLEGIARKSMSREGFEGREDGRERERACTRIDRERKDRERTSSRERAEGQAEEEQARNRG